MDKASKLQEEAAEWHQKWHDEARSEVKGLWIQKEGYRQRLKKL